MIALRLFDPDVESPQPLTLRGYYEAHILPEIRAEQADSSLREDRYALNQWERLTGNPALDQVTQDHIVRFRDGLQAQGKRPATMNKLWRELRSMFNWAADEGVISRAPQISRRSKSKIAKEQPKRQREALTLDEVAALYRGCRKASYPHNPFTPAPKLWRLAIVLWHFYGARTMDFLEHLTWDDVLLNDRLLRFTAQKTSKLQGLPLTDLVIRHLESVKAKSRSPQVFPGFKTKGCYLQRDREWKRGYYTTWKREIQPDAELSGILIKHFREAMVTRNNAILPGLGAWMAGHYMPGVTAQNYDLPTKQIREAVAATPVPECFHEID